MAEFIDEKGQPLLSDDLEKRPTDPSGNPRWWTEYATGSSWDLGRIKAVEEPCEFHRQQAQDLKLKRCVKCKMPLGKFLVPEKRCSRCNTKENLEEDHIVRRADGGSEAKYNKRWLCRGCHDYRHARDRIIEEIETRLKQIEAGYGNQAQLTMWVFRLGILEYFNVPSKVRERGYKSYGAIAETHYSRWAEAIKALADWRSPYKAILVDNQNKLNLYAEKE